MVGPHPAQGRCNGETLLPFGSRPWCDVPAAASSFMPAPIGSRDAGASALAVPGKEAQHSTLVRTRRAALELIRPLPIKERCASERSLSFGTQPWYDVPGAASSAKPASCHAAQPRQRSLSLGRRGVALELASRARRAAIVVEGSSLVEVRRTGERTLFTDATAWCDVPAAASNFKPAPRVSRGTGASALAVSGMKTQHSSLLRVRAVPRSMWSVFTLSKGTATARCFLFFGAKP
jgi:hypothetical protein